MKTSVGGLLVDWLIELVVALEPSNPTVLMVPEYRGLRVVRLVRIGLEVGSLRWAENTHWVPLDRVRMIDDG